MAEQWWNWVITAVGLAGFFLAGKKIWWAWYVNIVNQILWFTYGFATEQWGFVVGTFFYTAVFVKNAIAWTKEHRYERLVNDQVPLNVQLKVNNEQFREDVAKSSAAVEKLDAKLPTLERDQEILGEVLSSGVDEEGFFVHYKLNERGTELLNPPPCGEEVEFRGKILTCESRPHDDNYDHQAIFNPDESPRTFVWWSRFGIGHVKERL